MCSKVYRCAISTGHSRKDCGAIGINGVKEYDLNCDLLGEVMANNDFGYLKLLQIDIPCEDFNYPKHLFCTVREQINKTPNLACCVELHHNSVVNPDIRGAEAIYWDSSIEGERLAQCISLYMNNVVLCDIDGIKHYWRHKGETNYAGCSVRMSQRHVGRRLYYLRKTNVPACIVEPGYISNAQDLQIIRLYMKPIGFAIAQGIALWVRKIDQTLSDNA